MSKTMTWNYIGEADITIGERHASPIPKILTSLIILSIVVVGILVFIKRDVIYDKLNNPHIVLTQDSITIDYQGNFNALDYIDKNKTLKYNQFMEYDSNQLIDEDTNFPYKFTYTSNVDTSTPGNYTVMYSSSNHLQENETILNVTVSEPVDEVAPTITLTTNEVTLYYNHEDIQTFDPMEYIKSLSDDKSSEVYLRDNLTYKISESGNTIQLSNIQNLYVDTNDLDSDVANYSIEEMEEFIGTYTDLVNNTSTNSYSIEFTTKDESDNASSTILDVIVVLDVNTIDEKLQARIGEWNNEQDELINQPSSGNGNTNEQTTQQSSNGSGENKVLCLECNRYIPQSQFGEHLNSHH